MYVTDTMGAVFSLVLSEILFIFYSFGNFWTKGNIHSQTLCLGFLVMESIMLRSLLSIPVAFAESAISNSCSICYLQ